MLRCQTRRHLPEASPAAVRYCRASPFTLHSRRCRPEHHDRRRIPTEEGRHGDRQGRSKRHRDRERRRLPEGRSPEVEGRAPVLLVPQQRRRHARAAGRGIEGLRHRHVTRRHPRVPEAAGDVGPEQGAERLRRQDAREDPVRQRARRRGAPRQGRLHRSRSGRQAARRRTDSRTDRGSSIRRRASARRRPTARLSPRGRRARRWSPPACSPTTSPSSRPTGGSAD